MKLFLCFLMNFVISFNKNDGNFPKFIQIKNPEQSAGFAGGGDSGEFTRWHQPQEHMLVPFVLDIQADYNPWVAPDIKKFRKQKLKVDRDLKFKLAEDNKNNKIMKDLYEQRQKSNDQANNQVYNNNDPWGGNYHPSKEMPDHLNKQLQEQNGHAQKEKVNVKDEYDSQLKEDIKRRIFFPIFSPEEGKSLYNDIKVEDLSKKYPNIDINSPAISKLTDELIHEKIDNEGVVVLDQNQVKEKLKNFK